MPNMLSNFGLQFFEENQEEYERFITYLVSESSQVISGYYEAPTLFFPSGNIDFYVKTRRTKDNKLEVVDLDTHCCGTVVNTLENTGIDITPADALPTERVMLLRHTDGTGMLPVHIVNADVLPSFLSGDVMDIQLCAIPLDINYYADESEYCKTLPEVALPFAPEKQKLGIADGAMLALTYLSNHNIDKGFDAVVEQENNDDDCVIFKGVVKELLCGYFELNGKQSPSFVRCIVDTEYGEMQFVHTLDMISEEMQHNMQEGAIVCGVCIVSGDVALNQYANGFVKDFSHNIRLVRQVMMKGEAERLRPLLKKDSVYESETSEKCIEGPEKIIDWFNYVSENRPEIFVHTATITETEETDMEYPVGTSCLILAYNSPEVLESLCFIDVDDAGMISRIKIISDRRYHFKIEEKA